MLDQFIEIAPKPKGRETDSGIIEPTEKNFQDFENANLDQNHRIAFLGSVGKFERNKFFHHVRLGKSCDLQTQQALY